MKKLSAVITAAVVLVLFAACGEKAETAKENAVTELLDQGYAMTSISADETVWKCLLQKEDNPDTVYVGKAPLTSEKYEKYAAIEFDDTEGLRGFVAGLEDVTVTDLSDRIPTQEALDAYVGKTVGELEDDGFENSGNITTEDGCELFYDGPEYSCTVTIADGTVIEDWDDYSPNDIRALIIGAVTYTGISPYLLDNA